MSTNPSDNIQSAAAAIFRPKQTKSASSCTSTTRLSTDKSSTHSASNQSALLAEQQWNKAYEMLEANPQLMTSHTLCMALKRNAPAYLIRFMLRLNPKAADIPQEGPTALQIAVQSSCPVDVVKEVLLRCPFALVATNPGSHLAPLAYTRIHRSSETELIKLLDHPVSYWVQETGVTNGKDASYSRHYKAPQGPVKQEPTNFAISQRMNPVLSFLPYTCGTTNAVVPHSPERSKDTNVNRSTLTRSQSEDMDLDNIKLICASVLKGHKRLARDLSKVKKNVSELTSSTMSIPKMPDVVQLLESHAEALLSNVKKQHEEVARKHLAAFETKERALRSHVRRVEQHAMSAISYKAKETEAKFEERFENLVQDVQGRLSMFSHRLDSVEALAQEPVMKYTPARSEEEMMYAVTKAKFADDKSPQTVTTSSLSSSFDTCFSPIDTWGFPISFLSADQNEADEVRSLLTEGDPVESPGLQPQQRRAKMHGKRLSKVFCKSARSKHEI